MYIIAIAWLYVVVLMAATEKTIIAGILTFVFYGLVPCALLLWILGRNHRHFKQHQGKQHQNQQHEASQSHEDEALAPEKKLDDEV